MQEVPTNTIILTGFEPGKLQDDELIVSHLKNLVKKVTPPFETIKIIKLPKFQRVFLIFEEITSSIAAYDYLTTELSSLTVGYSIRSNFISTQEFLQLPDQGTRFVISPPSSPPPEWDHYDKVEGGPDMREIHSPDELRGLLFRKLGDRITHYDGEEFETNYSVTKRKKFEASQEWLIEQMNQEITEQHKSLPFIIVDKAEDNTGIEEECSLAGVKTRLPGT
ncbi:BA75_04227T0 [Komagataella pastoris]|uniref:BA75_04227T0 n=1 Tax=Komagataella pastoris TaxID=4922 RepID=A0A1B2JE81_PICPA|nr:BA75_04227T0 [Komagataella pastoris]